MNSNTRRFVASVTALGLTALAIAALRGYDQVASAPIAFLAFAVGMILAERFVIHLTFSNETMSFSMVELAMTIALLTMPPDALVLAAGLGMAGGQLLRRRPLQKVGFNTGMYALSATGGAVAFVLLEGSSLAGPHAWGAAFGGMAVFYVINQMLLAAIVGLLEKQNIMQVLRAGAGIQAAMWLGNVTFGLLSHRLFDTEPLAISLLVVPLALSYAAYRAWVRSTLDSRKSRSLYDVGASLTGSLGDEDSLQRFLGATRSMFRASGAEIVLFEGSSFRVLPDNGPERTHPVRPGVLDSRTLIEAYISSRGWDSYRCSPLVNEVGISGALVIHDHRGPEGPSDFDKQDGDLLQMLANQASVTIRNFALFQSVSRERKTLSDIVEHTSDGIYQVGSNRRILTWNPAMESITGFTAAEAVGQMSFNVLRLRDGKGVDVSESFEKHSEAEIMTKDGAARWIDYSHSAVKDASGTTTSTVVVVRDITRQRAEQAAKDDFIATVSHELRTPLTPLKGFLQTLLRHENSLTAEQKRDFYESMLGQTERLERLVGDLLQVSTLEAGASLPIHPTDVERVVLDAVATFRSRHPERSFSVDAPAAAPALANKDRLAEVLAHLIDNSVRYSPEASPIDVTVTTDGTQVTVAVHDRGPGISQDDQAKIFERFFRSGSHMTRVQGGTGLGLYLARTLTEAMGGEISVVSRLGHGSTFLVRLSAAPEPRDSDVRYPGSSRTTP